MRNQKQIIMSEIGRIMSDPKFVEGLAKVGGHNVYHLEGNALQHTLLVYKAAVKTFGEGHWMTLAALIHDCGKINHHVKLEDGSYQYPHHSDGGAEELDQFLNKDMIGDEMFNAIQWMVFNHIKPMYWRGDKQELTAPVNHLCDRNLLIQLVLCDLAGSQTVPEKKADQEKLKRYLRDCMNMNN